jgi:hypothetical protein
MVFLNTAELQSFADFATGYFMTDTCDILRRGTTTWNAQGGNSSDYAVIQSASPCCVISQSGTELFSENQEVGKAMFLIVLPKGTDIKTKDRIHVGTIYYEVIDALDPSTFEIVRKVTAQRFGKGGS